MTQGNEVRMQDILCVLAKAISPHTDNSLCPQGVNIKCPKPVQDQVTSVFTLLKWSSIFMASLMIQSMSNATISSTQLALSQLT